MDINNLIEKLKKGEIRMKPRWHFILRTIIVSLVIFVIALFVLFLISFIAFSLRLRGFWDLFGFGFPGIMASLRLLPGFLIFLSLVLIVLLELLAKRFDFVWKRPVLYSLLAIIIIVFFFSFLINKASFHRELFERSNQGPLPVFAPFYKDFAPPELDNVYQGVVLEKKDNELRIETDKGDIVDIILTDKTHIPRMEEIRTGDKVIVLVMKKGDKIEALGVKKINNPEQLNLRFDLESPPRFVR